MVITCRTVNGLDINALDNFKENIKCVIEGRFDDIDDVFSGVQKDGRGNICPTTIILPTLAMMAKIKVDKKYADTEAPDNISEMYYAEFMKLLTKKIEEAKDMLLERFNHICSQSPKAARFMYENHTMSGYHEEEGIISALKHGTIVIGQLGLSETLLILFGFDHTSEKGMGYAKEIETLFNIKCNEFKQQYKLNFGVYLTPAENLCYKAMQNFKKMYPTYEQEGVTFIYKEDEEGNKYKDPKIWMTNSIHVPVNIKIDPFKKIDIESQLTALSNAGCITYEEIGDIPYNNIDAIETLIDYAMEHDIPYEAVNLSISQCHECGERIWDLGMSACPKCGCQTIDVLGRVTGYLSTEVKHFNKGKQEEFANRVKHFQN